MPSITDARERRMILKELVGMLPSSYGWAVKVAEKTSHKPTEVATMKSGNRYPTDEVMEATREYVQSRLNTKIEITVKKV